jgi:DNA-binding NtrC family response regulator
LLSAQSGVLTCAHLGLEAAPRPALGAPVSSTPLSPRAAQTLRATEQAAILQALEHHPNDRRAAARSLGLSRSAFYRRLAQYGLNPRK